MKPSKSLAFAFSAARHAPKYPRARNGIASRPAFHHPDPLVNNPNATVTELEGGELTFIHRPPPSAPSPHSTTLAPISPLLQPRNPQDSSVQLPPLTRGQSLSRPVGRTVTDAEILRMRALRNANPEKYTRKVLAEMFDLPESFVGFAAGLKKSTLKKVLPARDAVHQESRERWSERHSLVKAIQKRRRELW